MMQNEEQVPAENIENEVKETISETDQLKLDVEEQKEKFIRLYAEFDNFKRRNAKERVELIQTAGRDVIQSMLEVMDDCDRAEKQLQTSEDLQQIKQANFVIILHITHTCLGI